MFYSMYNLPDEYYLLKVTVNVRENMQKPYVLKTWGSEYPDKEKPLYALGLINKDSKFIVIDGEEIVINTGELHVAERVLMTEPDVMRKDIRVVFPAKPRWCNLHFGELSDLSDKFGKIKMKGLLKVLEGGANAN